MQYVISFFKNLTHKYIVPIKFTKQTESIQKGLRRAGNRKRKWEAKGIKKKMIDAKCWPPGGIPQLMEIVNR